MPESIRNKSLIALEHDVWTGTGVEWGRIRECGLLGRGWRGEGDA